MSFNCFSLQSESHIICHNKHIDNIRSRKEEGIKKKAKKKKNETRNDTSKNSMKHLPAVVLIAIGRGSMSRFGAAILGVPHFVWKCVDPEEEENVYVV
jgi:hypothetical protein